MTLALPMPELPPALGHDIDGIVGGEFIKEFVTQLDYQTRSITLHDRKTFRYSGTGETLPLDFNSDGHPVIRAAIIPNGGEPIEHRFLLDVGSGLAIALHSPFVAAHGLPGPQSKTVRLIGGVGAGGRVNGRLGRLAALRIGSFTINNPVALFAQDKAGAFADASLAGNIGAQIASRFHIVLDYAGRRIILEPSATFEEPFDSAFSGINLRAEGPDYHIFRVREVLENSPATEAGIEEGDVITAIDRAGAESLTLTAINEMLEKPVPRELTVRRGERLIKIKLTPANLV